MATVTASSSDVTALPALTPADPSDEQAAALPDEVLAEFSADEYFAMVDADFFLGRRVFLWNGRLCEKMPKSPSHVLTAYKITRSVVAQVGADWLVWPENPVQLSPRHAPLPDIAFVRGPLENYEQPDRHPTPLDVGLLVEVAVTSLPKDLGSRVEVFARAGIPVYWVADVLGRRIVRHREPTVVDGVGRYTDIREYQHEDEIEVVFDGRECGRIPLAEFYR